MAQSSPLSAHELRIRISDKNTTWTGTRAQLEAEGFIPADAVWPIGNRYTKIELGKAWGVIRRAGEKQTEATADTLYRFNHYCNDLNLNHRMAERKVREAAELMSIGTPQWRAAWELHYAARRDLAFQTFKNTLLGLKKRGRKPGTTTLAAKNSTQGATA